MSERTFRRIKTRIEPGPIERYLKTINPVKSLGEKSSGGFFEYQFTISIIMFFSLLIAILSSTMFHSTQEQNIKEKYLISAIMAISWFVFANFSFLVFEGTRLFNILLFTTLMIMASIATVNINNNEPAKNIGISIVALSVFPLVILLYYFLTTEKDEVTKLKTIEREKRHRQDFEKELTKYKKQLRTEIKKELEDDVSSETGVRNKVAQAYIDALINNANQNVKVNLNIDKNKDKNKDKDKDKNKNKDKDKDKDKEE